jgi:hypothetical protein
MALAWAYPPLVSAGLADELPAPPARRNHVQDTVIVAPRGHNFVILYSFAEAMAAIAACSAQNPVPEPVSMHTPQNTAPASVTSAAATSPSMRPSAVCGFSTASPEAIRAS